LGSIEGTKGEEMRRCSFKKLDNGWRFQIGGTNGEAFGLHIRYFNGFKFRITVDFNTDTLIRLFGFNQRVWEM